MPTPKFQGERRSLSGHPQQWPGTVEGYPVKGWESRNLKDHEYDGIELTYTPFCETFQLAVPEQKVKYREVLDRIVNGLFLLIDRKKEFDPETKDWIVHLEWSEVHGELPKEKPQGYL